MTVVVAMVDAPREGLVLPGLVDTTPLSQTDATSLYAAFVKDLCRAAADSGGDLLLNYRPEPLLPKAHRSGVDPQDAIEDLASDALSEDELAETRIEVQVGSTESARVGNTVTHLLGEDAVDTVTVCDPANPLRSRQHVDSIAMKLRRSEVVLAPGGRGRVSTAAFSEPIDFDGALTQPSLTTLTDRARDVDLAVDFAPQQTVVDTHDDLVGVLAVIRARQTAGRWVPQFTSRTIDDLGLALENVGGEATVVQG